MSDNQEYEKLAGLTMDEAQVILLALYIADTQKTKTIVHFAFPSPFQLKQQTNADKAIRLRKTRPAW